MNARQMNTLSWIGKLVAAVIMLQTLFYKFTAAAESVFIFTKLGVEPWGRIMTGIFELIAAVLILVPKTSRIGAIIATIIMTGAIASHIFILGITIMGDKGLLFCLALIVLAASLLIIRIQKLQAMNLYQPSKHIKV